ncbi:AAA family ATPase [Saccharothrix obliqua]|uniref:AAA family ATPase n=1 Tax=Saccharothrix obliqua TaxID=2861747 RepID=UPI001C5E0BD4|nr:LuxR family transcriptional regulator [Saccharothrix obliqua]MBW4721484.1 AAA family ATPase [Saccharothrix obliqua]
MERESVLTAVDDVLAAVVRGDGGCLVVEGPPGIGKTRVLAAAVDRARAAGVGVALGRAAEYVELPLAPLLGGLRSGEPPVLDEARAAELVHLGSVEHNRYWLVERLTELVERHVRHRPLMIVLDDAQWADELTLAALRVMVPALRTAPVLWLIARRPAGAGSPVGDVVGHLVDDGARRVELHPLSDAAVAEVVRASLAAEPDQGLLDLAVRTGNNPFLLEELLRTLREEGRVRIADGVASAVAPGLPTTFLTSVAQRMRWRSESYRRLLEAAAVLGRPFTVHEAAGVTGRPSGDLLGVVEEAVDSGMLVDDDARLAFRHDILREAVYDGIVGPVRSALHREASLLLRASGAVVEAACHLVRSGTTDERAVPLLREAARSVAHAAPGVAADMVLQAVDLMAETDPARPVAAAEAVRLLAAAGRVVRARELGERVLRETLPAEVEAEVLLGLAEAVKHAGHESVVLEYARRALDRPGVPDRARAHLHAIQAHGHLQADDLVGADRAGGRAAELGEATGEHAAVVFGLAAQSVGAQARGDLGAAIVIATRAVDIAERFGGDARHRHPRLWLAPALAAADRFTEASAVFEIGRREAERLGTGWSLPLWHYYLAELHVAEGRVADAQAEAEAGLRVAERLDIRAMASSLEAVLARAAVRRDALTEAREHLGRVRALVDSGIGVVSENLRWTRALVLDALGKRTEAWLAVRGIVEKLDERVLLLVRDPGAGPQLVRLALRAGGRRQAEGVVDAVRSLAADNPGVASLTGAAAHAEGLLTGDPAAFDLAVRAYRESPRPFALASALEDGARVTRDRDAAVGFLNEALARYATTGARRDTGRVRRRLRGLGVRPLAAAAGRRPATGWDSLTESELRVVRLVAEGLTNRETAGRLFLSPHTVDSHLRHAFAKLGLSSRVELTRRVLEHDSVG